jgi:hypothetical protein
MTKRGQQIRRAVRDERVLHQLVRLERAEATAVVRPASSLRPRTIPPRDDGTAA